MNSVDEIAVKQRLCINIPNIIKMECRMAGLLVSRARYGSSNKMIDPIARKGLLHKSNKKLTGPSQAVDDIVTSYSLRGMEPEQGGKGLLSANILYYAADPQLGHDLGELITEYGAENVARQIYRDLKGDPDAIEAMSKAILANGARYDSSEAADFGKALSNTVEPDIVVTARRRGRPQKDKQPGRYMITPSQPGVRVGAGYDEMGQPLYGRSDYHAGTQFTNIISDAKNVPLGTTLSRLGQWSIYSVPDAAQRRAETMDPYRGMSPEVRASSIHIDRLRGGTLSGIATGISTQLGADQATQDLMYGLGSAGDGLLQGGGAMAGTRLPGVTNQRALAIPLFRGVQAGQRPEHVFESGMRSKGDNMNLAETTQRTRNDSGFVATTPYFNIAHDFAGKNGYIYEIVSRGGGKLAKEELGKAYDHPRQNEVAFPRRVDRADIRAVYPLENGLPTGQYIRNPYFVED